MIQEELVTDLKNKTGKLIDHHKGLMGQNNKLNSLVTELQHKMQTLIYEKEELLNSNRELKEQIKTIKLAQSLSTGGSDQPFRQGKTTINEYIREIDKCLALLNRE